MSSRRSRALALAAALGLPACTDFALWVEPQPEPKEIPVPPRFEAEEAPKLVPTEHPALLSAPTLSANLYFYEPDGLWYRRWRGRWYQAFTWDGHWFPPRRVPEVVRARGASTSPPAKSATPDPPAP
jgi:hypothetical protein